jgi:hypothetical protein
MDGWTALFVLDVGALCGIGIAACGLPRRYVRTPEQLAELDQVDQVDHDDLNELRQVDDDAERYAANSELATARVTSPPRAVRQRARARPTAPRLSSAESQAADRSNVRQA